MESSRRAEGSGGAVNIGRTNPRASEESIGQEPVYRQDRFVYRVAVIALAAVAIVCPGLGFWAWVASSADGGSGEVPDFLIALASASIGALAGLFASGARG